MKGTAAHVQMVFSLVDDASQCISGRALMFVPDCINRVSNLTGSSFEDRSQGFVGVSTSWQKFEDWKCVPDATLCTFPAINAFICLRLVVGVTPNFSF